MSNTLIIRIVEVRTIDSEEVDYGFIAADNYASVSEVNYPSLKSFLEAYPTKDELIQHVLASDAMYWFSDMEEDGTYRAGVGCSIAVQGYPEQDA